MNEEKIKKEEAALIDEFNKEQALLKSDKVSKSDSSSKSIKKLSKRNRQVYKGQAHIQSTYNNTIVTLTDLNGLVLGWSSAGLLGFKGAKKSTPYAASQIVANVVEKVQKYGIKELQVFVKGVGGGRDSAVRALATRGFIISLIKDVTPIAHNGCKRRKPRRV
jgi:small subunit ribosomal protein S11